MKVKIQCPECGELLVYKFAKNEYMCIECIKLYSEHEIRERCAI